MTRTPGTGENARASWLRPAVTLASMGVMLMLCGINASAQGATGDGSAAETTEQKVDRLAAALVQAQTQMEAYQKQLLEMRQQLSELQTKLAAEKTTAAVQKPLPTDAKAGDSQTAATETAIEEIRERQSIEDAQIATLDTSKVESSSKYPLKVSGMLLLNAFVNTHRVDVAASPAYALSGSGSTGLSFQQTVLGFDARGPHLLNASSRADLRVDFFAKGASPGSSASGLLRLRTAHAILDWKDSQAFVEYDRTILEPNLPTSMVAIAQPELAWAGNLWTWNPQIGASHAFPISGDTRLRLEAAFIDTSDPVPSSSERGPYAVTQTEYSRWPGSEARISIQRGQAGLGPEVGVGGYFSPHRASDGTTFNAWAGTIDARLPVSRFFEITAKAYRGQALAGLGAGGYINYYTYQRGTENYARAMDDVGGWAQLKSKPSSRIEFNTGFGTDNPFAKEVTDAIESSSSLSYSGLARNRGLFSNVIYSPSAYLLFSFEYRRFLTNFATGPTYPANIFGLSAGYRF